MKKKIYIALAVLFVAIVGGLSWYVFYSDRQPEDNTPKPAQTVTTTKDIATVLTEDSKLSNYISLLTTSGVVVTLQDTASNFLVIAPTNDAIKKLPDGFFEGLLSPAKLTNATDLAKYHVLTAGTEVVADVQDAQKLKMLNGREVIVSVKEGVYTFTDTKGRVAVASKVQNASNGIVYIVDNFLLVQ